MPEGVRFRWLSIFLLSVSSYPALAEICEPPQLFLSVPAGDMRSALDYLASAFSYQLVIDPVAVNEVDTDAQQGCGDLAFWINQLLSDAPLSYSLVGDTLVIFKARRPAAPVLTEVNIEPPLLGESEVLVFGKRDESVQQTSLLGRFSGRSDVVIEYDDVVRMGITDLASALQLASGVKLEQERYMIIRGMKGRYQSVRINGGVIPSLGPARQSVPMDMFPVSILNHVDLRKSVYADAPGSSTAGMVNIETLRIPKENFFNVMAGAGYRQGTTGQEVIRSYESDTDWLGYDDGARSLPELLEQSANRGGVASLTPQDRERAGESIPGLFGIYRGTAGDDLLFNLSAGRSWQADNVSWGVTGSLGYKNNWQNLELDSQLFGRGSDEDKSTIHVAQQSEHQRVENTIDENALLAGGLNIGGHNLGFNALWLRQATSYTERIESSALGAHGEETGQYQQRSLLHWTELDLSFQQLYGKHLFAPVDGLAFYWQASTARSEFYQPFNLGYRYRRYEGSSYQAGFGFDQLQMRWQTMKEDTFNLSAQLVQAIDTKYAFGEFKLGFDRLRSSRDGNNLAFSFKEQGDIANHRAVIERPNPSDIFTPELIIGDESSTGFILTDKVLSPEQDIGLKGRFYAAENTNRAIYLLADITFLDRFKLVQGIRQERNSVYADLWDYRPEAKTQLNKEHRFLPSFSLTVDLDESQQFHIGYSRTLAWPSVSELMPIDFEEIDTRITVRGNPDLKAADAENLDFQWLYSAVDNRFTVKNLMFYKNIENAIEGIFVDSGEPGAVFNSYTFKNSAEADVFGYELEFDINLLKNDERELNFNSSYARIYSRVNMDTFADDETRPLQGQPDYIAGVGVKYRSIKRATELSLFFKRSGRELYIVSGTLGVPPVYQEPLSNLHLAVNKEVFDNAYVTLSVDNLLDGEHRYLQGGHSYLNYRTGREYKLRFSFSL